MIYCRPPACLTGRREDGFCQKMAARYCATAPCAHTGAPTGGRQKFVGKAAVSQVFRLYLHVISCLRAVAGTTTSHSPAAKETP